MFDVNGASRVLSEIDAGNGFAIPVGDLEDAPICALAKSRCGA